MATLNGGEAGIYLIGELVSAEPGRPWKDRNGVDHVPFVLSVLIGKYVESVEFEDEASARKALPTLDEDAEARALVTVPVRARGSWDDERRRFGRVSFLGRRDQ